MSMVENLWGIESLEDISTPDVPKRILAEQAALLRKITNGLLYGDVEATSDKAFSSKGELIVGHDDFRFEFNYGFYVCAPALGDYHHLLFSVHHDIGLYPCFVVEGDEGRPCQTEDDFTRIVHSILSSERVRRIVESLVAQSAA
jgi:hypothetical protein